MKRGLFRHIVHRISIRQETYLFRSMFQEDGVQGEGNGEHEEREDEKGSWSRGDILRVRLEIDAQADMTWVAVNDSRAGGRRDPGNRPGAGLAPADASEDRRQRLWPAFEERSFEAFRAYYDHMPKGTWTLEYALRLNQPGAFSLPQTRVEALYAPEVFGESPNETIEVHP